VIPAFESLVHGARELKMFGRWIPIRAEVRNLDMLSAHADGEELLQWLRGFATPPKRIQLTHGEPAAADALRQRIAATLGWSVAVAEHGEVVEA
jgi:metallo-beta-lactamase family protein